MNALAFDVERFHALRAARGIEMGSPFSRLNATPSTMDVAREAARAGAPSGALFLAEFQTQGRGRQGRLWHSAAGENLMFSLVYRPQDCQGAGTGLDGLTLAVGLAVRAAVARHLRSVPVTVKWPNDVLASDRKLAGVLVEGQVRGGAIQSLVIGVGINVAARVFPADLQERATSLRILGATVSREELLVDWLDALRPRLAALADPGVSALTGELNQFDALRDHRVRVGALEGWARGISPQGALQIQDGMGVIHSVVSGEAQSLARL